MSGKPMVIVPCKSNNVKSRLSPLLGPLERKTFSKITLIHVLGILRRAGLADSTFVVSSDPSQLSTASRSGIGTIRELSDKGVTEAVRLAMGTGEGEEFMVVPSDLPALKVGDIRRALELSRSGVDTVISPSRAFDGTNLLLFSRGRMPRLSYDSNSFWNHLASAASSGLRVAVLTQFGQIFDVDSPEDFRVLARLRINSASASFAKKVLHSSLS